MLPFFLLQKTSQRVVNEGKKSPKETYVPLEPPAQYTRASKNLSVAQVSAGDVAVYPSFAFTLGGTVPFTTEI